MDRREALNMMAVGASWALSSPQGVLGRSAFRQEGEIFIRGGTVVRASGGVSADVRVRGSRVAEVGPGLVPGPGARVFEAQGKLLLPGGIDPHVHFTPPWVDDFTSGSRAALAGGITTVGAMWYPGRDETLSQALDVGAGQVAEEAIADVMLHTVISRPTPELIEEIPILAERGQTSLKVYMVSELFDQNANAFVEVFEAARDAGILSMVHCEDAALVAAAVRRLQEAGTDSMRYFAQSRPVVSEVSATQRAVALAEDTRAPMYAVHLSSKRALDVCREARARGVDFFVESRPLYLHLTEERFLEPDGAIYVGQPPLRSAEDQEALWQGIAEGDVHTLATDHAPWTREQKLDPERTVANPRAGVNNLQVMLPMLFSEGVVAGRISLERFVAVTAEQPAKLFGLYPRKGIIEVGSDADLVLWDPQLTRSVRGADGFSNAGFSVYEGWEVTGWPLVTLRRGEVVFEDGRITAQAGSGELIRRDRWSDPDF